MTSLGWSRLLRFLPAALIAMTISPMAADAQNAMPPSSCRLIATAVSPTLHAHSFRQWKPFAALMAALRQRESSGNYRAIGRNGLGFLGAYQFTEIALQSIGWYEGDETPTINDWIGNWTAVASAQGVTSKATFLETPRAQDTAWVAFAQNTWSYGVSEHHIHACIGMMLDDNPVTASGIIGGAHLVGMRGVAEFLLSRGRLDTRDPYGTPVSEYVRLFSGYRIPWFHEK